MKKQQLKPGDIVRIRPAWCDTVNERKTHYCVIEEAGENKWLIQLLGGALMLKPTEIVTSDMIEFVTTLSELEERS